MPKYTKKQIDQAILALEIYGSNDVTMCEITHNVPDETSSLVFAAWCGLDKGCLKMEALEAAALLREGLLPVYRFGVGTEWE